MARFEVKNDGSDVVVLPDYFGPMIDRTKNTAMVKLRKDEALELIAALSREFVGVDAKHKCWLVLEGPESFYPKDRD